MGESFARILEQINAIDTERLARILYLGMKAEAEANTLEPVPDMPGLYTVKTFKEWKATPPATLGEAVDAMRNASKK